MGDAAPPLGLGKVCPRCGTRSNTLGGVCPACKRPYIRRGLLDRLSVPAPVVLGVLGIWLWLLGTSLVAGILIGAVAFVGVIAAIGLVNAAEDRQL